MSTYAIGDLQGCYSELKDLLDTINFDATKDRLWFVGDLVNRGPESLACLEFVKSLGDSARSVLGNHDLHLLAVANNIRKPHKKDTLDEILNADNANELLSWVRGLPLLVHDSELDFTMIHAGLPPQWSLEQARELTQETAAMLRSGHYHDFLAHMYGNEPVSWSDSLIGHDRYRYIINCLTRVRYLDSAGHYDLSEKSTPGKQPKSLTPWYAVRNRKTKNNKIIFGHWSTVTLGEETNFRQHNVYPLDTGCLWGGDMTAMRLEDEKLFSVPSRQTKLSKA